MHLNKVEPKYIKQSSPRIGLITLASDFRIEKDFNNVIYGRDIDLYVNRIECFNPLTKENLIKMSEKVTEVTKDILPDEKIDCVAYGCTSGTIAAGFDAIQKKIKDAKPEAIVTTPSTASIKALKKLNVNKVAIFTPYSKKLNDEVLDFFKKENLNLNGAEALFVSCTALPALSIINKLEEKLNKFVLSSNQTLIWDSLNAINYKEKIEGFGKLFNS
jgi:maleate isomerase